MKYNALGFVVFAVSFGAAYAILYQLDLADDEGLWMMLAGPAIAIIDVVYRLARRLKLFGDVQPGPSILFLPAWVSGAVPVRPRCLLPVVNSSRPSGCEWIPGGRMIAS